MWLLRDKSAVLSVQEEHESILDMALKVSGQIKIDSVESSLCLNSEQIQQGECKAEL